jgi:hypothetical protein
MREARQGAPRGAPLSSPRVARNLAAAATAVACITLALILAGCSSTPKAGEHPGDPVTPPAPILSSPEDAARSYLDWISFAYLIGRSDVATPTMTPNEEVRVDSYVEFNRQESRRIEQKLAEFEVRSKSSHDTTATLAATERWAYRYIDGTTGGYAGPEQEATYETTYTLVRQGDSWLVDAVEATPLGQIE